MALVLCVSVTCPTKNGIHIGCPCFKGKKLRCNRVDCPYCPGHGDCPADMEATTEGSAE